MRNHEPNGHRAGHTQALVVMTCHTCGAEPMATVNAVTVDVADSALSMLCGHCNTVQTTTADVRTLALLTLLGAPRVSSSPWQPFGPNSVEDNLWLSAVPDQL